MMKVLKSKKGLMSVCAMLVAIALVAGSTYAWFVWKTPATTGDISMGLLKLEYKLPFTDVVNCQPGDLVEAVDKGPWNYDQSGDPLGTDADGNPIMEYATDIYSDLRVKWGYLKNVGTLDAIVKIDSKLTGVDCFYAPGDTALENKLTVPNAGDPTLFPYELSLPKTTNNESVIYDGNHTPAAGVFNTIIQMTDAAGNAYFFIPADLGAPAQDPKIDLDAKIDMETKAALIDYTYNEAELKVSSSVEATQAMYDAAWMALWGIDASDLEFAFTGGNPGGIGTSSVSDFPYDTPAEFFDAYWAYKGVK